MANVPKIFVVDDDDAVRESIKRALFLLGYEVIQACNGLEALQKVKESPPDVILLDARMPKMDGFETLKRLKEVDDTLFIPVVMLTGLNDLQTRVKAFDMGADDFLAKPVDVMELTARIRSLLRIKAYNDRIRNYHKELESEVAKKTKELRLAYERIKDFSLETIYRLCRAAEYKDEDTGNHIIRISHYSHTIARKIGLAEDMVEAVYYAAPMHDIGKIGVPDHILLKPGRLEPEEEKIMQRHVIFGKGILEGSNSAFIRLGEEIAYTHHERWDGNGYPVGLNSNEIPISGRIVAIADVFDALTSKRPYKEPFSIEKSYEIIRKGVGTHFDPKVAEGFFEAFDEILAIRDRYKH